MKRASETPATESKASKARKEFFSMSAKERADNGRAKRRDSIAFSSLRVMKHIFNVSDERELIKDMREVLTTGSASYRNPHGADERESFIGAFRKMKNAARKITFEHLQRVEIMTDEAIREIIFDLPVEPPVYVDLRPGIETGDGREVSPFASTGEAEEALEKLKTLSNGKIPKKHVYVDGARMELPHAYITCHEQRCEVLPCSVPGCGVLVCREHGDGSGFYRQGVKKYRLHFADPVCMEPACTVAYCSSHIQEYESCTLCHINLCKDHAFRCNVAPCEYYDCNGDMDEAVFCYGCYEVDPTDYIDC